MYRKSSTFSLCLSDTTNVLPVAVCTDRAIKRSVLQLIDIDILTFAIDVTVPFPANIRFQAATTGSQ